MFNNYADLEKAFAEKQVHPGDLKNAVGTAINRLLDPIRKKFEDPLLQKLTREAYPDEAAPAPKEAAVAPATKAAKGASAAKPAPLEDIAQLDIRVGLIKSIKKHPEADSLYVEEIDVGEDKPRTIVSGLAKYYTLEQMENRKIMVICNMKPAKLRGISSEGMVLCASSESEENRAVELLDPPADAKVGERVTFAGYACDYPANETLPRCNDKKMKAVLADLKTDGDKNASYKGVPMTTSAGIVTAPSLANVPIA